MVVYDLFNYLFTLWLHMKIKVAAIQMCAELADVSVNLTKAEKLIRDAGSQDAKLIILPEFFTSACAFHPAMFDAILPMDGKATQLLKNLAQELDVTIGGSFIAAHDKNNFNTFVLVAPQGDVYTHNKDIPTMWENCYYTNGDDDGVLQTPLGNIGVSLCWEMLRSTTAKRLLGKVNIVVSGSCWWDMPDNLPKSLNHLREQSLALLQSAPVNFAKILGVPVVHAAHAGKFAGYAAPSNEKKYNSQYLGESVILNGNGDILARLSKEDGEGVITAELDLNQQHTASMVLKDDYWIPEMPAAFIQQWNKLNKFGREYYAKNFSNS